MHVDAGAIQTRVTHGQAVFANAAAHIVDQVNVEGGGHNVFGGVAHSGSAAGQCCGQALRAVFVFGTGLADGFNSGSVVEAQGDGVDHLVEGQLIQQGIPLGIVIVGTDHGNQSQTIVSAQGGHFNAVSLAAVVTGESQVISQGLGCVQHNRLGGEGGNPVGAAQPGNFARFAAALVGVCFIKQVGDGGAGFAGGVGGAVQSGVGPLVGQGNVAIGGHAAIGVLNGVALGSQDVVHSVVCIGGSGEVVVASVNNIGLGVVGIIGAQLALVNGDVDSLGSAGSQDIGLGKAAQLSRSLLDAVGLVVIGVGALEVQLNGFLAGVGGTGVGDFQGDIESISRLGHIEIAVLEGGVAVAIAEGEGNSGGPVVVAGIAGAHNSVLVAGLVVTVIQVDAFLIHAVHTLHIRAIGQQVVICCVGVSLGIEVVHGGVGHVVIQVGINQAAGRGSLASQQLGNTVDAGLAHVADPHSGIDAVILAADFRVQEIHLNGVGRVDQNDDLLEGAVVLQGLQVLEQFLFFSGQGQVVTVALLAFDPGIIGAVFATGQVSALAAGTGEHDDSSIAVVSKAGLGAGQLAPGSFVHSVLGVGFQGIGDGSRGDAAVVLHHIVRRIQIPQGAVDLDALIFQSLLEVGSLAGINGAGTGAAVHQVHGAVAEQADLCAACQGQGVVVVLQQGCAFGFNLCAQLSLIGLALFIRGEIALEVLSVFVAVAPDDLVGVGVQVVINGGRIMERNRRAYNGACGQDGGNGGQAGPHPNFGFLTHCVLLLLENAL